VHVVGEVRAVSAAPPRKRPVRRVFGRMLRAVPVSDEVRDPETGEVSKPAALKSFWFELKQDGLHVRRFRARRRSEIVWPLRKLANGTWAGGQMQMF